MGCASVKHVSSVEKPVSTVNVNSVDQPVSTSKIGAIVRAAAAKGHATRPVHARQDGTPDVELQFHDQAEAGQETTAITRGGFVCVTVPSSSIGMGERGRVLEIFGVNCKVLFEKHIVPVVMSLDALQALPGTLSKDGLYKERRRWSLGLPMPIGKTSR